MASAVALGNRSRESANSRANDRAPAGKKKRRESLHIKDATAWPDPKEALIAEAASKRLEQQARQERRAAEKKAEVERRAAEEQAEAERRAAAEKAEAERRVEEEKARLVVEALEAADAESARLEAEAVARREAKKKAKADALERKARRISAAQWAEPSAEVAVWPAEFTPMASQPEEKTREPVVDGTPPPQQQQRYAGRLARARSSNRLATLSRARAASSSSVSSEDTPPVPIDDTPMPMKLETAAVEEEAAPVEETAPIDEVPVPVKEASTMEEASPVDGTPTAVKKAAPAPMPTVSSHAAPVPTDEAAPASASKPKKGSAKDLIARFNSRAA